MQLFAMQTERETERERGSESERGEERRSRVYDFVSSETFPAD